MKSSQTFADNVRKILKNKNIPIGQFEDSAEIPKGYLSRVSACAFQSMKLDLALNIADALGMTLDEIFDYEVR